VIDEVDAALARLLKRDLGKGVEVGFEPPSAGWAGKQRKTPLLDVHLFEVREETVMRAGGPGTVERQNGGGFARRNEPRWFRLSYWLSSWAADVSAEHELLARTLSALAAYDALPPDVIKGDLARLDRPVRMAVATPPAGDAHVATVWSSLDVPMRAALELAVIAPLEIPDRDENWKPVFDRRLKVGPPLPPPPPARQVPQGMPPALVPGGMPRPAAPGAPPPGAPVPAGPPPAPGAAPAPGAPPAPAPGAPPAPPAAPAAPAPAPAAADKPAEPAAPKPRPWFEVLLISRDPAAPPRVEKPAGDDDDAPAGTDQA